MNYSYVIAITLCVQNRMFKFVYAYMRALVRYEREILSY